MQDDNRFLKINFEEPKNSLNQNTMMQSMYYLFRKKCVIVTRFSGR